MTREIHNVYYGKDVIWMKLSVVKHDCQYWFCYDHDRFGPLLAKIGIKPIIGLALAKFKGYL